MIKIAGMVLAACLSALPPAAAAGNGKQSGNDEQLEHMVKRGEAAGELVRQLFLELHTRHARRWSVLETLERCGNKGLEKVLQEKDRELYNQIQDRLLDELLKGSMAKSGLTFDDLAMLQEAVGASIIGYRLGLGTGLDFAFVDKDHKQTLCRAAISQTDAILSEVDDKKEDKPEEKKPSAKPGAAPAKGKM